MEIEVLGEIMFEKFMNNPHCLEALLATGDRLILKATGDKKWGYGVHLARIHTLTNPPSRENQLGKLLEKTSAKV